jgi:hypothetical protein
VTLGGEDQVFVVLDTNTIHLDIHLSNTDTALLLEKAAQCGLEICLPEIVVQEMVAHCRRTIEQALRDARKANEKLGKLLSREVDLGAEQSDVDQVSLRVEPQFRALLAQKAVRVLPMPAISSAVQLLVDRDLAHRKPFKTNGQGMRDALIWESILELCRGATRPVALISANKDDFGDSTGEALHVELLEDLAEVGFPPENAELHQSIRNFNEKRLGACEAETSGSGPDSADADVKAPQVPLLADVEQATQNTRLQDDFIISNALSDVRKRDFLEDFKTARRETGTTEMLFEFVGGIKRHAERPPDSAQAGFRTLFFKGPFVEGSNWLPPRAWELAVAMERHRLATLEEALRNALNGRLGSAVNRDVRSVLDAMDDGAQALRSTGYDPSVFVLTGPLGMQLQVDLAKSIVGAWEPEVRRGLRTTFRILGMHSGMPILDIAQSASPAVHVVDLRRFASLDLFDDGLTFALEDIDAARAAEMLRENPNIVVDPPPESGQDLERIRVLRLRVRLELWEAGALTVHDSNAAVGRPLVGDVLD